MRKQHVLTVLTSMLGASVLMCSTSTTTSTQPDRYWAEFSPTEANFRRHFDENMDSLDPIEGIWVTPGRPSIDTGGRVAIVQSSVFGGFGYVGVALEAIAFREEGIYTRRYTRGDIFIAFRKASGSLTYGFSCASVLRGEACANVPCDGVVVIADGDMRAESQLMVGAECTPNHWVKSHPRH
jgi:hypothetical protein